MKFHILTLFPEMIHAGLHTSIIGRALEKKLISVETADIREYSADKHGKADDYTYGGGAGMLMQAQPVFDAYQAVSKGKKLRTVYVTPQGSPFTQKAAAQLAREEELVFLCGHYEGIDERVLEEIVTDYVSIGDYVLTGGELPAMVMIDAIARLVPGVLHNDASAQTESFYNDLLEYPQYSRPEVWHGKAVPAVLLSGNHGKIRSWRLEQSIRRTAQRRPDLYEKYREKQRLIKYLSKDKRNHIHMIESLARGRGEILYAKAGNILIYDENSCCCMVSAKDGERAEELLKHIPEETRLFTASQYFLNEMLCTRLPFEATMECVQYCYPQKQTLPVKYKEIRPLVPEDILYVAGRYHLGDAAYLEERIGAGEMYGAFEAGRQIGFIGLHREGSMGLLYVEEAYRGRGIASALEAYCINRQLEKGFTPYGHITVGNEASVKVQEKLGLYAGDKNLWWLERK